MWIQAGGGAWYMLQLHYSGCILFEYVSHIGWVWQWKPRTGSTATLYSKWISTWDNYCWRKERTRKKEFRIRPSFEKIIIIIINVCCMVHFGRLHFMYSYDSCCLEFSVRFPWLLSGLFILFSFFFLIFQAESWKTFGNDNCLTVGEASSTPNITSHNLNKTNDWFSIIAKVSFFLLNQFLEFIIMSKVEFLKLTVRENLWEIYITSSNISNWSLNFFLL